MYDWVLRREDFRRGTHQRTNNESLIVVRDVAARQNQRKSHEKEFYIHERNE
jgi:hypothetical protein